MDVGPSSDRWPSAHVRHRRKQPAGNRSMESSLPGCRINYYLCWCSLLHRHACRPAQCMVFDGGGEDSGTKAPCLAARWRRQDFILMATVQGSCAGLEDIPHLHVWTARHYVLSGSDVREPGHLESWVFCTEDDAVRLAFWGCTDRVHLDRRRCLLILPQSTLPGCSTDLGCPSGWLHIAHSPSHRRRMGHDRCIMAGLGHLRTIQHPHELVSEQRTRKHQEGLRQCSLLRGILHRCDRGTSALDRPSSISERRDMRSGRLGTGVRLRSVVLVGLLAGEQEERSGSG